MCLTAFAGTPAAGWGRPAFQSTFKTCQQSGFCRRQRRISEQGDSRPTTFLVPNSLVLRSGNAANSAPAVVGEIEQSGLVFTFSVHGAGCIKGPPPPSFTA